MKGRNYMKGQVKTRREKPKGGVKVKANAKEKVALGRFAR